MVNAMSVTSLIIVMDLPELAERASEGVFREPAANRFSTPLLLRSYCTASECIVDISAPAGAENAPWGCEGIP
jgi:hypothetical protein